MKDDLISRSALKAYLEEIRQDYLEEDTMSSNFAAEVIETVQDEYLANAPAVDAVPVVRCKDCKYCLFDLSGREAHLCMRMENGFPVRRRRKADDFCSYGERKDNALP